MPTGDIYIYIIPEVCIVLYYIVLYYIILYHISNIICWILYHFTILFGGFGPAIPTGHPFGDVEVHQFGVGAKKKLHSFGKWSIYRGFYDDYHSKMVIFHSYVK